MEIKSILLIVCLLAGIMPASAIERYDIECAGTGSQGSYLVKISVFSDWTSLSEEDALRCAVHGIIFKGFSGKNGCTQQKAMAQSPAIELERADFFDAFFNSDLAYRKYVTTVEGSQERSKVGKEYRVSVIVTVSKDLLRSDLEKAGIIRGLSNGF